MRNLVPTVITNKNGVVTTVYRKPAEALENKKLAPVPLSNRKSFYALRKALNERIKELSNGDSKDLGFRQAWRKRIIKEATADKDLLKLERLDQYFDVNRDEFEDTFETIALVGGDPHDDTLFHQVISMKRMIPLFAGASTLVPVLPLIQSYPDRIEEIAHCWNVISVREYRAPTAEEVSDLFHQPHTPSKQLPGFLAESVELTETPVADYRLVCKQFFNKEEHYAHRFLRDWDRQTVAYMAGIAREGKLHYDFIHRFRELQNSPRAVVEYAAMLRSVTDLLGSRRTGTEPHLRGPNAVHMGEAIKRVKELRERTGESEAFETPEDLARYSAQIRFMLTIEYENWSFLLGILPKNRAVVELLREHTDPAEVKVIVDLFNERGIDPVLAKERLKDHRASAINEGWL